MLLFMLGGIMVLGLLLFSLVGELIGRWFLEDG